MEAAARCLFAPIRLMPEEVASYRREHDPLGGVCPPHVTLVFPFRSPVDDEALVAHITLALADQTAFGVAFAPARRHPDGTVQLAVTEGSGVCRVLHQRLYSGLLAGHLSAHRPYSPHVTIGRGQSECPALQAQPALIGALVLERIGQNDESLPIQTFRLGDQA